MLLALETRRLSPPRLGVVLSGYLSLALLALAVLRPARVTQSGHAVGPRVVVLVDGSLRLSLPGDNGTRWAAAQQALDALGRHFSGANLRWVRFGDEVRPLQREAPPTDESSRIGAALESAYSDAAERPAAVVVVSDGRFSKGATSFVSEAAWRGRTVHTVSVTRRIPADASVREIELAPSIVAHQQSRLRITVGCGGALHCEKLPVTVRELRSQASPALLASIEIPMTDGEGAADVPLVLERAGTRVLDVRIGAQPGDEIPANDHRMVPVDVVRDRLRLLHVAGRATYDVRTLRRWLKSDSAVDLVTFFILREPTDDTNTEEDDELSLIPFPVDELFSDHLPSFDAVILQDFDAATYKLSRHLSELADYVRTGGGLVMVGGATGLSAGGYRGSALADVLPVDLVTAADAYAPASFTPQYTPAGRSGPVTAALRSLLGDTLPSMDGTGVVGAARPGSVVLWQHPSRELSSGGSPMPLVTLGTSGDGRVLVVATDGTWRLGFSELAAQVAGRSYAAFWEPLVGWLMRDPRYESVRARLAAPCRVGQPVRLSVERSAGLEGPVSVQVRSLLDGARVAEGRSERTQGSTDLELPALPEGAYSAALTVGLAPASRLDFACEQGGAAWADSRPDPAQLERIAKSTQGMAVTVATVDALPVPGAVQVVTNRSATPVLRPWLWTLLAALSLGAHWWLRRARGLS